MLSGILPVGLNLHPVVWRVYHFGKPDKRQSQGLERERALTCRKQSSGVITYIGLCMAGFRRAQAFLLNVGRLFCDGPADIGNSVYSASFTNFSTSAAYI